MTSKLDKEELKMFIWQTSALKEVLKDILELDKRNLLLYNGHKHENYTQYFLEILARFRYNTEGLLFIIDSFQKDYRLKICINLLLRSVCSDMLTALYLLSFYDKNDVNNVAVKNELDIITTEYLNFLEEITTEDHELMDKLGLPKPETESETSDWIRNLAPDLFDINGKIKKRTELRQSTKEEIKEGLNPNNKFLTEKEKFQRIKQKGYADYGFIFIAFKYYSQFQHFNLMSKKLIETKPFHDIHWMAMVLDHVLMVTDIILQFTKSPNAEFSNEIKIIRDKIVTTFGAGAVK